MGQVEVKDYALWPKHIHGDEEIKARLLKLPPESTIRLRVAGADGVWRKMSRYKTSGRETPGLSPVGPMQAIWGSLYKRAQGAGGMLVDIEIIETPDIPASQAPLANWEMASGEERTAAWEAYKALWSAGWRSDGAYPRRDELHIRDAS
jgi:hypothetical protein